MSSTVLDRSSLHDRLSAGGTLKLVDVRLKADFEVEHLPGAESICVFEVGFMDGVTESLPEKDTPVCVYGHSAESHESRMAAEKLERAGYSKVLEYRDGIADWKLADLPLESEGSEALDPPAITDGRYELDLEESRIEWTGRNLINKHWGTLGIQSGYLEFADGLPSGGEVIMDMKQIACTDLAGDGLHDVLVAHLEDHDFFDVEKYPTARFQIHGSESVSSAEAGDLNLKIDGELTLKDITRTAGILASAGVTPEGLPAAQATMSINRTRWNVLYGSGKLFHRLAGHLVNDEVDLQLRMITRATGS